MYLLDINSSPSQIGRGWICSISLNLSTNSTSEAQNLRRDTGVPTVIVGLAGPARQLYRGKETNLTLTPYRRLLLSTPQTSGSTVLARLTRIFARYGCYSQVFKILLSNKTRQGSPLDNRPSPC